MSKNRLDGLVISLFSLASLPICFAVELPPPERLAAEAKVPQRALTVVEPHASAGGRQTLVGYVGLPLASLLNQWFGPQWLAPDREIVFLARDGYRSAISSEQFQT